MKINSTKPYLKRIKQIYKKESDHDNNTDNINGNNNNNSIIDQDDDAEFSSLLSPTIVEQLHPIQDNTQHTIPAIVNNNANPQEERFVFIGGTNRRFFFDRGRNFFFIGLEILKREELKFVKCLSANSIT